MFSALCGTYFSIQMHCKILSAIAERRPAWVAQCKIVWHVNCKSWFGASLDLQKCLWARYFKSPSLVGYWHGRIQRGGPWVRTPPGILAKMCLSDSWNGTGLIMHSNYLKYSHKLKKKVLNVETSSWLELETLTFLVKGLHPLKSGNHSII